MTIETHSTEETQKLAAKLVEELSDNESSTSVVVGLSGDLGAGKTTFVQGIAKALGIEDRITSPTFILQKLYDLTGNKRFKKLVHVDAYRLESEDEMNAFEWLESINNKDNLIFVEWPEKIKKAMPKDTVFIDFVFVDENTRNIIFP